VVAGQLADASCEFALDTRYRNEDHPKLFRLDPATRNLTVVDPSDTAVYSPVVLAPGARRLPIVPLISALYHDSGVAAGRTGVDVSDFMLDFNFSPREFAAYFDDDPALNVHQRLVAAFPGLAWTPARLPAPGGPAAAAPAPAVLPRQRRARAAAVAPEDLPQIATSVAPPAGSRWWDAEQAVRAALEADQWTVIDRTRQGAGFDFQISKQGRTLFIEVKSSAGPCAPMLTDNEYKQAVRLRERYVIAVVENFDPDATARILWIPNPADLPLLPRSTQVYPLPRAIWLPRAKTDL
jgi:hypothetical protein